MDIEKLIKNKDETSKVEFKVDLPILKKDYKNFLKDVSAFANTSGGTIIWGIDDKTREVVGVKNTTSKLEIITEAINDKINPCPPYKIDVVKYNDKKLIVVEIKVGKNPPYFLWTKANKEAYLRRGLSSIPGETYELKELILESLNKKWDTRVSEVKLEDVTFNDLKNEYKNKLGKTLTEDKFEALGLIDNNGMLTNTGVVFSDQGLFHSQVFCTRWLGLTMSEATDSKNFSGSLIKLLEQAETFVKNNTKSGWRIGNQSFSRINKYEYDIDSVREAILNGLAHRCYISTGCEVHVDIYDDRLEVSSPGKMPGDELIQNLNIKKVKSVRRNETICSIFDLLDYMERRGSGLKRIYDSYQGFDMKPTFRSDRHFFEVTFPSRYYKEEKHKVSNLNEEEIGTEDILDLTDNEIAVLNLINLNKSITRKELSKELNKGTTTIYRILDTLKEKGYIERIGTKKEGFWKVDKVLKSLDFSSLDSYSPQINNENVVNKTEKPMLSRLETDVLKLLSLEAYITRKEISKRLNRGTTTIYRTINSLKEKGYIERIGTKKEGFWKVL